jgi:hypothetical protein
MILIFVFRRLQLVNLSGVCLNNKKFDSEFKFIREKTPRFAICTLIATTGIFLGVLEFDLEDKKLLVHQVFNLEIYSTIFHPQCRLLICKSKLYLISVQREEAL